MLRKSLYLLILVQIVSPKNINIYRINAGGPTYVDGLGNTWLNDFGFNTGNIYSTVVGITGSLNSILYQTERWDPNFGEELVYSLPVSIIPETYHVILHFADIYSLTHGLGLRVFDVLVENQLSLKNFDIFSEIGGYSAITKNITVNVTDGVLDIKFLHKVENPKISAIEVYLVIDENNQPPVAIASADPISGDHALVVKFNSALSVDPEGGILSVNWNFGDGSTSNAQNPTHIYLKEGKYIVNLTVTDNKWKTSWTTIIITVTDGHNKGEAIYNINAGGPSYTDSKGKVWSADQYFNTGNVFMTNIPISKTEDQALFQSERWDSWPSPELEYILPVDTVSNIYQVQLYFADIYDKTHEPGKRVFDVLIENILVFADLDIYSEVGAYTALVKYVTLRVSDGAINIKFLHQVENTKISAIVVKRDQSSSVDLHVVIKAPEIVIDYDGDGVETVYFDGKDSHTHEPNQTLNGFKWVSNDTILGNEPTLNYTIDVGEERYVSLTISDDDTPPKTLTDLTYVQVRNSSYVPGNLVLYYETTATLIDFHKSIPKDPDFGQIFSTLIVKEKNGKIGSSPFESGVITRWLFQIDIFTSSSYNFLLEGGTDSQLFYNNVLVTGLLSLNAERHTFEARFRVDNINQLPLKISISQGLDQLVIPSAFHISHDQKFLKPIINESPLKGSIFGSEIIIKGLGFFPLDNVTINWGFLKFTKDNATITPNQIKLLSVSGLDGQKINISIKTPNGISKIFTFTYLKNLIPINFTKSVIASMNAPTSAEWGPDGRLYVASIGGQIKAFTFDSDYVVTDTQIIDTLTALTNNAIMGLAFNPFDTTVKLYISHGTLYANGGGCFTGTSEYSGQVTLLTGPYFDVIQPIIKNLPVSNHDHLVNGMQFDNNGDLLIAVGGNTNAGVKTCAIGDIPESPLSGAIIIAHLNRPGFNASINYVETLTGDINNDQVFGSIVDIDKNSQKYISVFASGLRNPWDLVFTTRGFLYVTDNGPNVGFGPSSLSKNTNGPDPYGNDELLLIKKGQYGGHPNRNRGRYDYRENVYKGYLALPINGDVYNVYIESFLPSTNGIVEYRANTFNGAMKGDLLLQKWNGETIQVTLTADGQNTKSKLNLPISLNSLDVTVGPGGVIFGSDISKNTIWIAKPVDVGATGLVVYDISPWRAPETGGNQFIIGGGGFGTISNTIVKIGGMIAPLIKVTQTKIYGIVPPGTAGILKDIEVSVSGQVYILESSFRYLFPKQAYPQDARWITGNSMPVTLGKVSCGLIDGLVYIVGDGNSGTLNYDTSNGVWNLLVNVRPHVGGSHAVEVFNGKLYLFGGTLTSAGKVQIYNPMTDTWSLGTNMPWTGFSTSSALIGGVIYVAGGIVGSLTVTNHAKYNPVTNTWNNLAPMLQGRNHAASGTDGVLFYVFGGKGPGSGNANVVANGFNTVQIYNPNTDSWVSSDSSGSSILPLPIGRGGMGKAVYYQEEFYVMGGETLDGPGATINNVYDRVDVYNPVSNSWRQEKQMITARHGIFPIMVGERIFVAGGGANSGSLGSDILEIMNP